MIIRNPSTEQILVRSLGLPIPANTDIDISELFSDEELKNSTDFLEYLANGTLISISDTGLVHSPSEALKEIYNTIILEKVNDDDKRVAVQSTAMPQKKNTKFYAQLKGVSDDKENKKRDTGGDPFLFDISSSDTEIVRDIPFLVEDEYIYMYKGFFSFIDAGFGNTVSLAIIASPVEYVETAGGNYDIDEDNKLFYSEGTGTIEITSSPTLVLNKDATGHWNYENSELTPNLDQTGLYDIYVVEKEVDRFIDRFNIIGTVYNFEVDTTEVARIYPGYFLRISIDNSIANVFKFVANILLFRERTV
jgi:hypothetical protein